MPPYSEFFTLIGIRLQKLIPSYYLRADFMASLIRPNLTHRKLLWDSIGYHSHHRKDKYVYNNHLINGEKMEYAVITELKRRVLSLI